MDDLHSIFMIEAGELVADIEKGLLQLEDDSTNVEGISKVFRSMHTLKGSASMFGFESVSTLTHQLETVYESIRNESVKLTSKILQVSFESLDHLKRLLSEPHLMNDSLQQVHISLLESIEKLINNPEPTQQVTIISASNVSSPRCYYIVLSPNEGILCNGTNTLYLVDDLIALGNGIAMPYFKSLPTFSELSPQLNYTCFEILLETSKTESDMRDVLLFVETECDIDIRVFDSGISLTDPIREAVWRGYDINKAQGFDTLNTMFSQEDNSIGKMPREIIPAQPQRTSIGSSIRVSSERLDELMNLVSELVTIQARLALFNGQNQLSELSIISENVEKITRRLRDNTFTMSLVPIESLVIRFQRLVRDLSKQLGKDIIFKTEGTDTEIDKSVIEKLTDPLLHLLRNSIDHGIESPDERKQKGKPKQGVLLLKSYYSGANVMIEISDDGAGINLEKVRLKAISNGLIADNTAMDEKELINLIFRPGFSTAEKVTGVSGRGVGMDVVRRNINDIRGEIKVTTKENIGSTFSICLPLTISIIDGLLVRIGETDFILPLSSVDKCYEIETKILQNAFNQWITLEAKRTPFIFLQRELQIPHTPPHLSQVIKIKHEGQDIGLIVDLIIGQYQAVLKPLGNFYRHQEEYSGATILGDGTVALVLDPNKLIRKLVDQQQVNLRTA
jgi:two-component system, chemotaxis family, sensor kinase CheA